MTANSREEDTFSIIQPISRRAKSAPAAAGTLPTSSSTPFSAPFTNPHNKGDKRLSSLHMEEDDEFGDLYTDVCRPFASQLSSAAPETPVDPDTKPSSRDNVRPPSKTLALSLNPIWKEQTDESLSQSRVSRPNSDDGSRTGADGSAKDSTLMRFDIEENDSEDEKPVIPGLSVARDSSRAGGDWDSDSDSEDDLQIVLNDNNSNGNIHGGYGGVGVQDGDDEDGDPLVIVADDGDANHVLGEQEWGDNAVDAGNDEKKEVEGKGNGVVGGGAVAGSATGGKAGFSGMGYHPFHSQFKYVRPGASSIAGSNSTAPVGAPSQARPPLNMGSGPGRGRGDWRLSASGMKNASGLQKGFHSGFGMPAWGSGRGQGGGLEFSLPSHKTIFEVNIDNFEEKPWRYQGIDITNFFNFGLNEESWKDYCKQLEQHRMETTMQGKIHVYESGRTEQEFDPDLPPELAAASGVHDNSVENAITGKSDVGPNDLKVPARMRPVLPAGRQIQVETGSGERLPSIDTRPPRIRDSDAIIEIVCQDTADDNASASGATECLDNEPTTEDLEEQRITEDNVEDEDLGNTHLSDDQPQGGLRRETDERSTTMKVSQNEAYEEEADLSPGHGGSPQQLPASRKCTSKSDDSVGERLVQDDSLQLSPSPSVENMQSSQERAEQTNERVDNDDTDMESLEERNHAHEGKPAVADGSSELEVVNFASDSQRGIDKSKPGREKSSSKALQELDGVEDTGTARSSENSKARSSSRETYNWREGADDEVVQADISTQRVARGIPDDKEVDSRRRDRGRKKEGEGSQVSMKARMDPLRGWDSGSVHSLPIERRKERDYSDGAWRRQENESSFERLRVEDSRKKHQNDELRPRDRSRMHENERDEKEEYLPSKRQLDNGIYKVKHDKESLMRRERDESLRSRQENNNDHCSKRKKLGGFVKQDSEKEDILPESREVSGRQKREKGAFIDQRRREENRGRERMEDLHPSKLKDGNSLQREKNEQLRDREERHKARQNHEGNRAKRDREDDRPVLSTGRVVEEKSWAGQERSRDDHKASEKEYRHRDSARQSEQVRKRERIEEKPLSHQEDIYARSRQLSNEDRRSRQEKPNSRDLVTDSLTTTNNRKHRESYRKNTGSRSGDHHSSRRSQEGRTNKANNMGLKGPAVQGSKDPVVSEHIPSSRENKEEGMFSKNELLDSRRGRSKLERWTSHNERDYDLRPSASSRFKDTEKNAMSMLSEADKLLEPTKTSEPADQLPLLAERKDVENDIPAKPLDDKHHDTVEKLKKRSERFKLPMPSDKEAQSVKKMENDPSPSSKTETLADSEVKPERPARKRRWASN